MSAMASQIISVSIVCSTVCSGADKKKTSKLRALAFVRGIHRWPVNSQHKGPETWKNVSISWRHHAILTVCHMRCSRDAAKWKCTDEFVLFIHSVFQYFFLYWNDMPQFTNVSKVRSLYTRQVRFGDIQDSTCPSVRPSVAWFSEHYCFGISVPNLIYIFPMPLSWSLVIFVLKGIIIYIYIYFFFTSKYWSKTWRPSWLQMYNFFLFFFHDDVIKWKHYLRYWPFVRGIHQSPMNSPHKSQWRGALMFSLICAWMNGWVNTHEAGD